MVGAPVDSHDAALLPLTVGRKPFMAPCQSERRRRHHPRVPGAASDPPPVPVTMRALVVTAGCVLVLGAFAATAAWAPSPAAALGVRAFAFDVVAVACASTDDGVCLAYGGSMPGPTLDVREGDTVVVTLTNRIAATIGAVAADPAVKARLAAANVSYHTHGMVGPQAMDGVAAHPGTQLVGGVAPPGGSFTYTQRAAFAGTWHYHDHVLGLDGVEGTKRGLYGALVVRAAGETAPDRVFDLHLHDKGPNNGNGLTANVAAGSSFEIAIVGLGDVVWVVDVKAPDGSAIASRKVAPGTSDRVRVDVAEPGDYTWTAKWGPYSHAGKVSAS